MPIIPHNTNKKYLFLIWGLPLLILTGCGAAKPNKDVAFHLRFLDEYVIPKDLYIDSTLVGGFSDLTYDGQYFYTVSDHPPVIYQFAIQISRQKIDTVRFKKTIPIPHKTGRAKSMAFDAEGLIFYPKQHTFILSSEGAINRHKNPFIAELSRDGMLIDTFALPNYFKADYQNGLRHNGVFEGLSASADGHGIWAATELPLKMDGPTVKLYKTTSPVRFTYFDLQSKTPKKQFAYRLGRLRKLPFLPFGMNGVSAFLEYKPLQFLVLERAFSAGHGSHGIRARLYLVDARKATNTLNIDNLHKKLGETVIPAQKKLIFDFNTIRQELTEHIVDNLEGIAFGPKLKNGHQSLILIADNNFNYFGNQLNQIILMEIIPRQNDL